MTDHDMPSCPAPDARVVAIVALLRGQLPPTPLSGDDWAAVFRFARDESVLRSVARNLRELGIELPFIANQRLLRAERREIGETLSRLAALKQLLAALAAARVQVIPLKGPFLIERLYGDASARPSLDLDLLVREQQWDHLSATLTALGYTPEPRREEPHKLNWYRGSSLVEVHMSFEDAPLMRLQMDDVWSRAQPAVFQGLPVFRLAAADELTALAMHAVRHRFDRLSMLLDLALAFEQLGPAVGPAFAASSETIVPGVLTLAVAMAERLFARPIATPAIAVNPAVHARTQLLADSFWQEVLTQQRPDVRWRGRFRFLLELEPSRRQWLVRRGRHLQRAAFRLEEADYLLAARLKLRGDTAVRTIRWFRLAGTVLRRTLQRPSASRPPD